MFSEVKIKMDFNLMFLNNILIKNKKIKKKFRKIFFKMQLNKSIMSLTL
jgi:hypothetical protein